MSKPTPMSAHKNFHGKPFVANIDMDNSGGATRGSDATKIPSFGVQKIQDKKTGRTKVRLNTPIQPTPAGIRQDDGYYSPVAEKRARKIVT